LNKQKGFAVPASAAIVSTAPGGPVGLPAVPLPLRIAIVGGGRIGSAFAFRLARMGRHDVTVVARPGSVRLEQLQRDRGIVNTLGERAEVRVADSLDEQTPYDLVIVTLLAHQVAAAMPMLRLSAAKCIQFMFNTFDPEQLRDAVGAARCSFGMPILQANFDAAGKLKANIGGPGQRTLISRQEWVDVFNAAGIPSVLEPDMMLWLRSHAPLCVAFESVSFTSVRRGGGAPWGEAMLLARGIKEGFALIRGLGFKVHPRGKRIVSVSPTPAVAALLWCVSRIKSFRELVATGEHECRAMVDVMMAAAPQATPPVRVSRIQAMKPSVSGK
jgi:2-dehydropantoate 2-reductase